MAWTAVNTGSRSPENPQFYIYTRKLFLEAKPHLSVCANLLNVGNNCKTCFRLQLAPTASSLVMLKLFLSMKRMQFSFFDACTFSFNYSSFKYFLALQRWILQKSYCDSTHNLNKIAFDHKLTWAFSSFLRSLEGT